MRRSIIRGLLSLGLMSGCGGVEADTESDADAQVLTSEDALVERCTGTYKVEYYSDATYTTLVGKEICLVCNRQVGMSGVTSSYPKYLIPFQLCP